MLVPAVFGMGEVVVVVQSNYTGQPLWCPVVGARASPNIISGANVPSVSNGWSPLTRFRGALITRRTANNAQHRRVPCVGKRRSP